LIETDRKYRFIINFLYYGIITSLIYVMIYVSLKWMMPFVIGFLIAMILKPMVDWLCNKIKIKRKLLSLFIVLLFYLLIGALFMLITVEAIAFLRSLFMELPSIYDNQLVPVLETFNNYLEETLIWLDPTFGDVLRNLSNNLITSISSLISNISTLALGSVSKIALQIPGIILSCIFVIISSFFFTSDFMLIKNTLKSWSSQRLINNAREVKRQLGQTTGKFFFAYLKIMSITFLELAICFIIIRMPNAIGLAFLIASIDILPVLGTGGVMIPWAIIELILGNYTMSAQLIVIYIIVTVIRNIIEPMIVGEHVGLHPMFMLIAMIIGIHLFGAVGILLFPIIAVIVKNMYELRKLDLEDQSHE
jgi:sporulation integral membrane protein YtvI